MTTSFISNDKIQAGIIAFLKANAAILAEMTDQGLSNPAKEIKEDQYKGREFLYPGIRVDVENSDLTNTEKCIDADAYFVLRIYTEQKSSKTCDKLAGIVAQQVFDGTISTDDFHFEKMYVMAVQGAVNVIHDIWMSAISCKSKVHAR